MKIAHCLIVYKMNKLDKNSLKWYIRQLLHLEKDIDIISDESVTHLKVLGKDFYIYIKTITYAGNPYPRNTTRAQLPYREEFDDIKNSDAIFLFWGYDVDNEVFVCWDPVKTKERLNEKQYVSFFSRLNMQTEVRKGKILSAYLQNDLKYVLFKLNDLAFFLLNINKYFSNLIIEKKVIQISANSSGILKKVEDDSSVKLLIDEQLTLHGDVPVLTLISNCMNEYGEFYHKMTLKDWLKVVKSYIENKQTQIPDEEEEINEPVSYMVSEDVDDNYSVHEVEEKQKEIKTDSVDLKSEDSDAEEDVFYVHNEENSCNITDKNGTIVFSSNGKILFQNDTYYLLQYNKFSFSIDLLGLNNNREFISIKRIINAVKRTPLYSSLSGDNYLEQIKSICYDDDSKLYCLNIGNKWFEKTGYYIDYKEKDKEDEINIDDSEIEIVYVDSPRTSSLISQVPQSVEINIKEEVKKKEPIDTNKLKKIFDNTVTSYKYFWFMAIISLAKEKGTLLISYKDIMIRMAAIAWPMIMVDDIKLGERDMMSKYLKEIHRKTSLTSNSPSSAVNNFLTQNYFNYQIKPILSPLLKNVPYRFLSPWIKYTSDEDVINKSQADDSTALYSLHKDYIVLNNDWWNYIEAHFSEIGENALRSFISYAKQYNSEMKFIKIKYAGWAQIANMQKK